MSGAVEEWCCTSCGFKMSTKVQLKFCPMCGEKQELEGGSATAPVEEEETSFSKSTQEDPFVHVVSLITTD